MSLNPAKRQKGEDKPAAPEEPENLEALQKLDSIDQEIEQISNEVANEIIKIERKYAEKRVPLFKKRNDIIKTIPKFWLKTFLNHPALSDFFTEEDQKVFEHLDELNVDDKFDEGCTISFKFKPNPYFTNETLQVEVKTAEDSETITPTEIKWKSGKNYLEQKKKSSDEEDGASFFHLWCEPQIIDAIKEEIWPNAAQFYHGVEAEAFGEDDDENDDEEDN